LSGREIRYYTVKLIPNKPYGKYWKNKIGIPKIRQTIASKIIIVLNFTGYLLYKKEQNPV